MDPRLWQLLNLSPGSVYVQSVQLSPEGSTVTLDCRAFSDEYPKGKPFQLAFKHCRDVRWQSVDPEASHEPAEALGVFLGEQSHHKPAVVYTGYTEMTISYSELGIDIQ